MDDKTQVQNQDGQNQTAQTTSTSPVQVADVTQSTSTLGSNVPISVPHREKEPIGTSSGASAESLLAPSETEPQLHPEVAEHGVETTPDKHMPQIHPDVWQAGVAHAKETVPVQTVPTGMVQFPISVRQAKETLKFHKKVGNSLTWLAILVIKHAKMMRQKIVNNN